MKACAFLLCLLLSSVIIAQDSSIYVSDAGNWSNPPWQILKYDVNGQNPEIFIYEQLAWPQDILFMEDEQTVLISNLNSGKITRYNSVTGAYIDDFITGISGPTRMKIGPDSLLYILQWNGAGFVKRYTRDGTYVDDFTSVGVPQSIGLDWDSDTNLYVSSFGGKRVQKFDAQGQDQGIFIDTTNLQGPTNIWFDAAGDLLVADYSGTSVKRFDASGNYQGTFLTGLGQSEGVAFYADGTILIGNGINGSVKHFEANGNLIGDLVTPGAGGLIRPNAVVVRDETSLGLEEQEFLEMEVATLKDSSFDIRMTQKGRYHLYISDATGSEIYDAPFSEKINWNPRDYVAGAYFLTVKADDGRRGTRKVVKL